MLSRARPSSLVRWTAEGGDVPLVCFPWAGAGAGAFSDWPSWIPAAVEVWGARLPGRESRLREPPVSDAHELAREFAAAIEDKLDRDPVLFGHCSGGLIAYEVAFELRRRGRRRASKLLIAAQEAPSVPYRRERFRDVREELQALGFTDPDVLDDPNMMELLQPAIAADFDLVTAYRRRGDEQLDIPVAAFVGSRDTRVDRDAVRRWGEETTAPFDLIEIEGDHLFTGAYRARLAETVGAHVVGNRI